MIDVVDGNGALWQYDDAGTHLLANSNVVSVGVAFDPLGREVIDVVDGNGALYQYDAAGTHLLAT